MALLFHTMIGFLEQNSGLVLIVIAALIALYGAVLFLKLSITKPIIMQSLIMGGVVWILFMLTLPAMTHSSLSLVAYSTDYLLLFIMSLGYASVVTLLIPPVLSLRKHLNNKGSTSKA